MVSAGCWWRVGSGGLVTHFAVVKSEIRTMTVRVPPLEGDVRGVLSTLAELYVHTRAGKRYIGYSTT
jgi:hypothetical protein